MGCQSLEKKKWQGTLVGLGTFKKVYRKTHMGRNPQTGK
jgi:nucleoid DNA-binding protein